MMKNHCHQHFLRSQLLLYFVVVLVAEEVGLTVYFLLPLLHNIIWITDFLELLILLP
jgi:hypothetical protein